jgi:hypothetical protein
MNDNATDSDKKLVFTSKPINVSIDLIGTVLLEDLLVYLHYQVHR